LRLGHAMQSIFGVGTMAAITRALRSLTGGAIPQWTADVPRPAGRLPATERAGAQAVYFPSCISRVMGTLPEEPTDLSAMEAFVEVARRAGVPVFIPEDVEGTCCGVPFSSKGYDQGHDLAVNRTIERFWEWSEQGRLPVVVDTSPCTYGLVSCRASLEPGNQKKFDGLRILDGVAFVYDVLLPRLTIRRKAKSVALHPVCSVVKMNLSPRLEGIARACSDRVVVPMSAGCCGFAGDRGFLIPELTESATRREAAELQSAEHDGYFSSSRTCEIGMTRATGHVYRSFLLLLEQATRQ
jgi:D-lactate dehydrogenase